jgi:hypothetical protein
VRDKEVATLSAAASQRKEQLEQARTLFAQVALAPEFADFLTILAYALVIG